MGNRMYMTDENALKIDYIRNQIEDWKTKELVDESEYYYLLASLIEAVPYISNISGTYGAYNKWWDKRALNKLELKEFDILNNKKNNMAFNEDGINLLNKISGDILYIDPPYNNRQYCPNYHVLETIATYDFPELKGVTGQRDYENKKSSFCMKSTVLESFDNLVKLANFKHIILSYSNEGLMSIKDIESTLKKYGQEKTFKRYEIPYRRFKSRKGKVENNLRELLFYIRKNV
jgi:adenine-specific DNA-methyltransferase